MNNITTQLFHLHLTGSFAQTGFGFSCMKRAFECNIHGYLNYISSHEIEMNLEGNAEKIGKFFTWCLKSNETTGGQISEPMNHLIGLNDFNIINAL